VQAARSLLSAIEGFLEPHEDEHVDGPMRGVFYIVQHEALAALRLHLPPAHVNRIRRESGLLTVCYGNDGWHQIERWALKSTAPHAGYRYPNGDGCGLVFRGSSKQLDQRYCAACQQSTTRRRQSLEAELEARYLRGKFKIKGQSFTIDGRKITSPERWRGRCVDCGEAFESVRVSASRCDRCSHSKP
jgi:hypothetical protein